MAVHVLLVVRYIISQITEKQCSSNNSMLPGAPKTYIFLEEYNTIYPNKIAESETQLHQT